MVSTSSSPGVRRDALRQRREIRHRGCRRRPALRRPPPARRVPPGRPAATLPSTAGTGGRPEAEAQSVQQVLRLGELQALGAIGRPRAAPRARCRPQPRKVSCARPSPLIWSSRSSTTSRLAARPARRRCATISSPLFRCRHARPAYRPAPSPTTGRTSLTPLIQNSTASSRMANRMLNAGPASSTRMRCQCGRRVKRAMQLRSVDRRPRARRAA